MPTALFAKARTAGLLALTLTLAFAASALAPAQASRLIEKAPIDSGSDMGSSDSHDCDSRREVKYYFEDYGFEHVKVSKTHDYYIYKVSGLSLPRMDPAVSKLSKQDKYDDYVRYVFLFDACEHEIVKYLQPRKVV